MSEVKTAEVVKQETPRQLVRALFERQLPEIAKALPSHLDPARFIRVALTACNQQPKLLQCTQDSLMLALMRAAQLGLEPDGLLGHGYLIPRKRHGVMEAQFQPGYQGLLDLARRNREVADVVGRVVHEKDEFRYEYGLEKDVLVHKPTEDEDAGPIVYAYGIIRFRDGRAHMEVLSKGKMDREHRAKSQAGDDSPWQSHPEAMYLKTALIVACKYGPKSIELSTAIAMDERVEAGLGAEPEEVKPRTPVLVSVESLAGAITSTDNAQAEKPKADEPAAPEPCKHPGMDARAAKMPSNKTAICACGTEFKGRADVDPAVVSDAELDAAAAVLSDSKPASGDKVDSLFDVD